MYWMKNQSRQENLIYLAVWGMVFAAPLLSVYMHTINDSEATFDWLEIFFIWRKFAVFLLLFLIHNFLLAPLLVYKHRRWLYLSIAAVVLAGFTLYQCKTRPAGWQHKEPFPKMMERFDKRPPLMDEDEDFPQTIRHSMICPWKSAWKSTTPHHQSWASAIFWLLWCSY